MNNKHNCVLSNTGLSNAPTKTGICTSLKSDFYFRFHSPLNTKSALLNFICIWDLVLICWKMWRPEPENCWNPNPHTHKIGKLQPVCLTKNRRRRDHIYEPHAKFGENRWRIVDVIPNRIQVRLCASLKSDFYFRFHSPLNTKSALPNFICTWDLLLICWKCGHQSLKTAKIRIRTSLKSANYFRFVSQTTGVEATTFLNRMQNLVKIGEELWT